jgi:hypothetical protein
VVNAILLVLLLFSSGQVWRIISRVERVTVRGCALTDNLMRVLVFTNPASGRDIEDAREKREIEWKLSLAEGTHESYRHTRRRGGRFIRKISTAISDAGYMNEAFAIDVKQIGAV